MHFTNFLGALTALPILALAAPTPDTAATTTGKEYYLQAKVLQYQGTNPPHSHFDGTYTNLYHTGAGFNDVTLGMKGNSTAGFLNATTGQQQFSIQSYHSTEVITYTMQLPTLTEYTTWQPTTANDGTGATMGAFFMNSTGLQWNSVGTAADPMSNIANNEFGGWLACDWWHDVPQLFWRLQYNKVNRNISANCAAIDLVPVYVN